MARTMIRRLVVASAAVPVVGALGVGSAFASHQNSVGAGWAHDEAHNVRSAQTSREGFWEVFLTISDDS